MNCPNRNIELSSPVGSFESLVAAIQAKASSIYFGIKELNMRVNSSKNFMVEDIPKIVSICKKHKVKIYLTLNTVMYDDDMNLVRSIIQKAKTHAVDAIIAADFSVLLEAEKVKIPIHISTQVNVTNIQTVRFYSQFADVIILARELTLKQVNKIYKTIEEENICGPSGELVRIEIFIHGAMCMAISGKCYLSLHNHNLSANRGQCRQDCRKEYIVTEKETDLQLAINNEHIMSSKDLCTIGFLNKILDAGVSVLKIEGRARSPEYVKTVTKCYAEAIEAYKENTYSNKKIKNWKKSLATVFNRGFWDGYYLGQRLGEWSDKYGTSAKKRKIYIGKATNYFPKFKVAEFLLEANSLSIGDEVLIMGPTTGVHETKIKELRVDLISVKTAHKNDCCSIPIETLVRRSDKLYKVKWENKCKFD